MRPSIQFSAQTLPTAGVLVAFAGQSAALAASVPAPVAELIKRAAG